MTFIVAAKLKLKDYLQPINAGFQKELLILKLGVITTEKLFPLVFFTITY